MNQTKEKSPHDEAFAQNLTVKGESVKEFFNNLTETFAQVQSYSRGRITQIKQELHESTICDLCGAHMNAVCIDGANFECECYMKCGACNNEIH